MHGVTHWALALLLIGLGAPAEPEPPHAPMCMMLIANLQYAWTLFVGPIRDAHGWNLADIQWAFTIFIATETWITPFAGYAVDRMGW